MEPQRELTKASASIMKMFDVKKPAAALVTSPDTSPDTLKPPKDVSLMTLTAADVLPHPESPLQSKEMVSSRHSQTIHGLRARVIKEKLLFGHGQ
jgi:hypothetical protein